MDAIAKNTNVTEFTGKKSRTLPKPTREDVEAAVKTLLAWTGDDPDREGLVDTPKRVINSFDEMFGGYDKTAEIHLEKVFEEVGDYGEMILVRDIPFYSHCEHHIVPFFGKVHVAYYPNEGVVGLSKLARVVDVFAKRLQTQENLTCQIAEAFEQSLNPIGAAVMIEAEHMCMSMRGIKKSGASTVTTKFTGKFEEDTVEQTRFLSMIKQ